MDIDDGIIEELRLGALTAIDGLWFLAAEKKFGFESALEMDLEVWRRYGVIQLKRLARMIGLELDPRHPPDLPTINVLLETLCRIDGTECRGEVVDSDSSIFTVYHCSWWENLSRAGRQDLVPCELVDESTFGLWLEAVDPSLEMETTLTLPRGDDRCEWVLRRKAGDGRPADEGTDPGGEHVRRDPRR